MDLTRTSLSLHPLGRLSVRHLSSWRLWIYLPKLELQSPDATLNKRQKTLTQKINWFFTLLNKLPYYYY